MLVVNGALGFLVTLFLCRHAPPTSADFLHYITASAGGILLPGASCLGNQKCLMLIPALTAILLHSLCTLGCLSNPAQEAHRGQVVPRNANLRGRGRCSSVRLQFSLELLGWAAHRSPRLLRFCHLPFPCFIRRRILLLQFVVSFFGISSIAA